MRRQDRTGCKHLPTIFEGWGGHRPKGTGEARRRCSSSSRELRFTLLNDYPEYRMDHSWEGRESSKETVEDGYGRPLKRPCVDLTGKFQSPLAPACSSFTFSSNTSNTKSFQIRFLKPHWLHTSSYSHWLTSDFSFTFLRWLSHVYALPAFHFRVSLFSFRWQAVGLPGSPWCTRLLPNAPKRSPSHSVGPPGVVSPFC